MMGYQIKPLGLISLLSYIPKNYYNSKNYINCITLFKIGHSDYKFWFFFFLNQIRTIEKKSNQCQNYQANKIKILLGNKHNKVGGGNQYWVLLEKASSCCSNVQCLNDNFGKSILSLWMMNKHCNTHVLGMFCLIYHLYKNTT